MPRDNLTASQLVLGSIWSVPLHDPLGDALEVRCVTVDRDISKLVQIGAEYSPEGLTAVRELVVVFQSVSLLGWLQAA